jgi:O-methyltransferase
MKSSFSLKSLIRRIHIKVGLILGYESLSRELFIPVEINELVPILNMCLPFTGIGKGGLIDNLLAAHYVEINDIKGDVVEAGVHMGGSIAALSLSVTSDANRKFWCYDTFSGMPEPGKYDSALARTIFSKHVRSDGSSNWCETSLEMVKENLVSLQAPLDKFEFIVGKVEDTLKIKSNLPRQIAVLRLDTDWYESTKMELEVLFPLVINGGVIIVDDYGKWSGSKKAVDEYFIDKARPFMFASSHRRIFIKR